MSVTTKAIDSIRAMIRSGELAPGERLPPEQELADRLGVSRGSLREAVRALSQINVLDVRRGDGTYVTSLAPSELLSGMVFALELIQTKDLDEVVEVRQLLQPTGGGARRAAGDGRATGPDARGDRRARAGHRSRRDRPPARPIRFVGVRRHRQRDAQLDPARPADSRRERAPGLAQCRSHPSGHRARRISGCSSTPLERGDSDMAKSISVVQIERRRRWIERLRTSTSADPSVLGQPVP